MTSLAALDARVSRIDNQLGGLLRNVNIIPAVNDPSAGLIVAGGIGTVSLADGAVTTVKIDSLAVTSAKIAALAVTGAKIANATIEAANIMDATITNAKIASLAVSKLTAGDLSVAVNLAVGGKITVGDSDPATNGGVLIDNDEVTVYSSTGASGGYAQMKESGIDIRSLRGAAFFSIKNADATRTIELTMDPSGGRSFYLSSNVNGAKGEAIWIDQTVPLATGVSISDLFSFGTTAIGMAMMVHVMRTDTGASLGHIIGSCGQGQTRYVSNTNTEASSGGTTNPSIALNGSNGIDYSAHATLNTRFMGLLLVMYT